MRLLKVVLIFDNGHRTEVGFEEVLLQGKKVNKITLDLTEIHDPVDVEDSMDFDSVDDPNPVLPIEHWSGHWRNEDE